MPREKPKRTRYDIPLRGAAVALVVATVTTASHWLSHAQPMLLGLGLGFVGVHYLAEPIGVWWSYAAGLVITMAWSGVTWLVRRMRITAA